jgi:hypothetical protein
MLRAPLLYKGFSSASMNHILWTGLAVWPDTISEPHGEWHQDMVVKLYHQWMAFYCASRLDLFLRELELGCQDGAP